MDANVNNQIKVLSREANPYKNLHKQITLIVFQCLQLAFRASQETLKDHRDMIETSTINVKKMTKLSH